MAASRSHPPEIGSCPTERRFRASKSDTARCPDRFLRRPGTALAFAPDARIHRTYRRRVVAIPERLTRAQRGQLLAPRRSDVRGLATRRAVLLPAEIAGQSNRRFRVIRSIRASAGLAGVGGLRSREPRSRRARVRRAAWTPRSP